MNDTPRTDNLIVKAHPYANEVVAADVARMLERENARLRCGLDLIRHYGGTTTDEGVSCNGSWCAEQARATLQIP